MFDHDHSAARGEMATQKLIVFRHDSELGKTPAQKLFSLVTVSRKDESKPARSFSEYQVHIDKNNVPPGVTMIEKV